jgi:hypothetical protein
MTTHMRNCHLKMPGCKNGEPANRIGISKFGENDADFQDFWNVTISSGIIAKTPPNLRHIRYNIQRLLNFDLQADFCDISSRGKQFLISLFLNFLFLTSSPREGLKITADSSLTWFYVTGKCRAWRNGCGGGSPPPFSGRDHRDDQRISLRGKGDGSNEARSHGLHGQAVNNLMISSVLTREITVNDMLKRWGLVIIANFIGSLVLAMLFFLSGLWMTGDGSLGAAAVNTALKKASLTFNEALFRGIGCNWLVCLAVWMALAARQTIGKISAIFFPIMGVVAIGFEHCIANMYFIPAAIVLKLAQKFELFYTV